MRCLLWVCLLATLATADRFEEHKPDTRVKGKLLAWRTAGGLEYLYRVPKSYHKKTGAVAAGAEMIRKACLAMALCTHPLHSDMRKWRKDADRLQLNRHDIRAFDNHLAALKQGELTYHKINAKFRP